MSKQHTELPEDLRDLFEGLPPVEEVLRELEANKTDWDRVPSFVAGYLKGLFVSDIYAALEDQKLSQSDLAERLGESRQYVSRVLKEQANFTIASMAKLACALGLGLTIRLHRLEERMEIVPATRRKRNVVKFHEQSRSESDAAGVGEEPAVYESGRKPRKAESPRRQGARGKASRKR